MSSDEKIDVLQAELRSFQDEVRRALVAIATGQPIGMQDGKIVHTVGFTHRKARCDLNPYKHHFTQPDGSCSCQVM